MAGMTIHECVSPDDPRIGLSIEELDTPTLLLDRAASDRNLRKMAAFFTKHASKLRPHFKNHKCITLARRQMAAGSAVGITCAKLAEAELLADHGFSDILIANQVVGHHKVQRLASLAGRTRIMVAVDDLVQAEAISQAASAAGTVVNLLIEVDTGMGRCGVAPDAGVLTLARQIQALPGVQFDGIQAFEGHLVNVPDRDERRRKAVEAMTLAVESRRQLESAGVEVARLSGCSTATYDCTGILPGVDEVQAGTYATMDRQYHRLTPEFEIALTVLVQVISRPGRDKAVLDLGVKGAGGEFGVPGIRNHPDVVIPYFLSEEHTVVQQVPDWPVGRLLQLIPSHACTTCNLHRELVIHENNRVIDIWPVEASGRMT